MSVSDELNNEQRAAVEHFLGPMLVVAGAGTGKTQVITRRVARLLEHDDIRASEVLALTFTERAASEMRDRLHSLMGWRSFQVPIFTFHAFGSELLARFGSHIGISTRGGLLNETQKALLLLQHIHETSLVYYDPGSSLYEFVSGVFEYIGELQNAGVNSKDYSDFVTRLTAQPGDWHPRDVAEQQDLQALYSLYDKLKRETGSYDHYDQMMLPLEVLHAKPNIIERLRREYRFVLVDEYQDTNVAQDLLVRSIVGPTGNIFAVGDDDQAIYGFRGADVTNILAFAEHYKLAHPIALTQNYRSAQPILDASYSLIQHNNPLRLETRLGISKRLQGQTSQGAIEVRAYRTVFDEQIGVANAIDSALALGSKPQDIAVLSSTHAPLKRLSMILRSRGIPFMISTSVTIFEQPELLSLWYLLQWIDGRANDFDISHVLLGPYFHWSQSEYDALRQWAADASINLETALQRAGTPAWNELWRDLCGWRERAREWGASRLLYELVFGTDVIESWRTRAMDTPRMIRVFEDLQRWLEHMQDFESVSIDHGLAQYLQLFPEPPKLEVTVPLGNDAGVSLLTVHAAKGLEFERVFLINCTQRSWAAGSGRGRSIPDELRPESALTSEHEFRRLMYVALTRAKTNIVVSFATQTLAGAKQSPTNLIQEALGEEIDLNISEAETANNIEQTLIKLQRFFPNSNPDEAPKLAFERPDGWIELGVTALASYEYCPYEFYLEQGLRLARVLGPQLVFGTILHRLFELYYRAAPLERLTSETWHEALENLWQPRAYERLELAAADLALAHQTLAYFLQRENQASRNLIGLEMPIVFELQDVKLRLRGKLDALFEVGGGVSIRDYKTGRHKTKADALNLAAKNNFQLRTYALALERLGAYRVDEVVLDYVVTQLEGRAELSAKILQNHEDKLRRFTQKIRAGEFAPNDTFGHTCAATKYYGTGEKDELTRALLTSDEEPV
jgi:DNA helicase-2/ATP-dependent DNA helicase PcrA